MVRDKTRACWLKHYFVLILGLTEISELSKWTQFRRDQLSFHSLVALRPHSTRLAQRGSVHRTKLVEYFDKLEISSSLKKSGSCHLHLYLKARTKSISFELIVSFFGTPTTTTITHSRLFWSPCNWAMKLELGLMQYRAPGFIILLWL